MARSTDASLVVTPPTQTRHRDSSADPVIVAAMVEQHDTGLYVSNGVTYKTYDETSNAAQVYRRAFASALGVEPHTIVSKSWGMDGETLIADKTKPGAWKFALTADPTRTKRTRKTKTLAPPATAA